MGIIKGEKKFSRMTEIMCLEESRQLGIWSRTPEKEEVRMGVYVEKFVAGM